VSEKKIGKSFQYDMPGDLVMTYLAEVSKEMLILLSVMLMLK
jgi:hypothetical protein